MTIVWLSVFADVPLTTASAALDFWAGACGAPVSTPEGGAGEFFPLRADDETPYVWVQRLDRAHGGAGWHPDLSVTDLAGAVASATGLGASVVDDRPDLVSLRTPAGQAFCVVAGEGGRRLARPREWPDGQRSLVDQVCLDVPPSMFDDEVSFWSDMTGWERQAGRQPEFERLARDGTLPLQVLLQRLGDDDTGGARAHVDLATNDVPAERRRHEALGATVVQIRPRWTTMRDPVGLTYCITSRSPASHLS